MVVLSRKSDWARRAVKGSFASAGPFQALAALLILTFLTGGAARSDVQSLIILRPVSVLILGFGLWTLRWSDVRAYGFLFWVAAAIFGLLLIQLVPLPPQIWAKFPGRDIVVSIDRAAELGAVWRPISLAPATTWNSFYSLITPLATLVLAVQLDRQQRYLLLPILLLLGLVSGLVGLLQSVGPTTGSLYLYSITNEGSAVGLFANRNHQATLLACLFPMLAVFASEGLRAPEKSQYRQWLAVAAAAVLVPLLLVTGSRSGLLAGIVGLLSVALLYRKPLMIPPKRRRSRALKPAYWVGLGAVVALGGLTALFSRAQVFTRLAAPDSTEDLRFTIWPDVLRMAWKYFPTGSGVGSFVEIYQIDERLEHLSAKYVNHAHNDWLETFLTGGLPALLIILLAILAWTNVTIRTLRNRNLEGREHRYSLMGSTILLLLAFSSFFDYPLRTPALMCVAVVAAVWCVRPSEARKPDNGARRESSLEASPVR